MRLFKKLFICAFVFACVFTFTLTTKTNEVNATGETTNANLIVKGAGVRTSGTAGMRFEVDFSGYEVPADKTISKYGIVIGYGNVKDITQLVKTTANVNGKSVLNCEIDQADEEGTYFISIVNIPDSAYTQDITARAYLVLSDDSVVYGSTDVVRNLTQVVVAAHKDPNYVEEDNLIKTIYNSIEFKELNDSEIDKINAINPDIIVSKADASKNLVVLKESATATKTLIKTYEYKPYSTITSALTESFKNYNIYVMDGTYDEVVDINVEGVTLAGVNYGIHGHETVSSPVVISKNLTISANNVTIDGIKLTKTSIVKADNATYNHVHIEAEPDTTCKLNNRMALIVDGKGTDTVAEKINDLKIINSYLKVLGTVNNNSHDYLAFTKIQNLTVEGNYIENNPTTLDSSADGLMIYSMYGSLIMNNNEFVFATSGYLLKPSYYDTTSFIKVEFNNNKISGTATQPTSTMLFNYLSANADVEIIGNDFNNVSGTVLRFDYAKTGTVAKVAYNSFDTSTSFKGGSYGKTDFVFGGNYFGGGINANDNFGMSKYQKFTTEEAMLLSYENYQNDNKSNINYVLNDGTNDARNLSTYVEYDVTKLYPATSDTKNFVGWTLTEDGTDYIEYLPIDQTGEVTVYAHWVPIITVSLTDNDLRVLNTYNPTIFVKSEFSSGIFIINNQQYKVSDGKLFNSISAAVSAASATDVIYVFAGNYSWASTTVSKTVKIIGPNAGIKGSATRVTEAEITAESITMNGSITLDGVKLTGTSAKTLFQTGTTSKTNVNATLLDIDNCIINNYQNVCRYENQNAAKDFSVYMLNSKFIGITQFYIWAKDNNHLARFDFIGNTVSADAWGGTALNSNFRFTNVRANCAVNIIGNDFLSAPGLSGSLGAINIITTSSSITVNVKYNKFVASSTADFTKYFHNETKRTTIADNVFVVGTTVQTTKPTFTIGTGSTHDSFLTSVADRDTALATYMNTYTK